MEALDLFPVSIYRYQHTDDGEKEYIRNFILEDIIEESSRCSVPEDWATDNLKTSFPGGGSIIDKHGEFFYAIFRKFLKEMFEGVLFDLHGDIWFNYYEKGSYQELHEHLSEIETRAQYSCIYFLSYDDEVHTSVEFHDPISLLRKHSCSRSFEFKMGEVGEWFVPKVSEGTFLVFPTYLQHRVLPQKVSDKPRITISFNISIDEFEDLR